MNQRRIDLINRVNRPLDWGEIMFYQMRDGKSVVNEEPMFPCRSEIVLAKIRFSVEGGSDVWTSQIRAVGGRMFSIWTRPSPKPISFCSRFTLKSVKLVDDPLQEFASTAVLRVRNRLPIDFEELAGKSVSGWSVFEASSVYAVSLKDADYYLLAERPGAASFLGVRSEGKSKRVYYVPHDDDPRSMGATLREAIGKT